MYFIVKKKEAVRAGGYTENDPRFIKAYKENVEKYRGVDLRKLSPERRWAIKATHFQGKTPELIAKSKAIRDVMSKEING